MHIDTYGHMQERHHQIIRSFVNPNHDVTNLEKGLAEELAVESLRQLEQEPIGDGFVNPHSANADMRQLLLSAKVTAGINVRTCVAARCGANLVHRGDVIVYSFDHVNFLAGDINFFASASDVAESAFVTAWERIGGEAGVWTFNVLPNVVMVPVRNICLAVVAHVGTLKATVIAPPAFVVM